MKKPHKKISYTRKNNVRHIFELYFIVFNVFIFQVIFLCKSKSIPITLFFCKVLNKVSNENQKKWTNIVQLS
jgi:hypothetical protein